MIPDANIGTASMHEGDAGNGTRPIKAPVTRMAIFWPDFFYLEN
jgi:hypothetical protein